MNKVFESTYAQWLPTGMACGIDVQLPWHLKCALLTLFIYEADKVYYGSRVGTFANIEEKFGYLLLAFGHIINKLSMMAEKENLQIDVNSSCPMNDEL